MKFYPNTLFHFTRKEHFFSILGGQSNLGKRMHFRLSLSEEKLYGPSVATSSVVPMVSFSDLRLSELKSFITKEHSYGYYGIGLSKKWAIRNGLNPVMYVSSECALTDSIINGAMNYIEFTGLSPKGKLPEEVWLNYFNLLEPLRYLKNYEGALYRKGELMHPNYRFADEREWRFVLPHKFSGKRFIFTDNENKEYVNTLLQKEVLSFDIEDVKYLIVKDKSEADKLIKEIVLKSSGQSLERGLLGTKVLTVDMITEDI